jgi:hypothetical protein
MAFTTGTDFTATSAYTGGADFHYAEISTGVLAATLPDLTGGFSANAGTISGTLAAALPGPSGSFAGISQLPGIFTVGTDFMVPDSDFFTTGTTLYFSAPRSGVISAQLPGPSGGFVGHNEVNEGAFAAELLGPSAAFVGHYDHNVRRYTVSELCSSIENAGTLQTDNRFAYAQAELVIADRCAQIADGTPVPFVLQAPVNQNELQPHAVCVAVDQASRILVIDRIPVESMTTSPLALCATGGNTTSMRNGFAAVLDALKQLSLAVCNPVQDAGRSVHDSLFIDVILTPDPVMHGFTTGVDFVIDPAREFTLGTAPFPYTETDTPYRIGLWHGVLTHEACSPRQAAMPAKLHQCSTVQDARRSPPGTSIPIDPPPPPPPPPPDGHETLVIPPQSSYTMQHVISVVTLVGNVAVPVSKVNLALNANAFAWQFSAILSDPGALSLVEIVDNEPVKLKITIDGYVWHTIVEEIEHSREFGKQAITLKGRGVSALLGGPYEQPHSNAYGSALTVQQLAEMQLPVGWTLNWTQETWLVPANAWSYTNQTPIQALAGIANDTGSMLVPARDSQSLTMMPRYPYWPWDFTGATPDLVIPEAAIKSLSLRPRLGTQANGVYVHGGDVGGVLGWCRFNGTDGARLAETRSNNLMTNVIGCRALGSRILAGQYTQPIVKSLTTYLDGDVFPLAEIGMLAAITIGAETERGIINSVAIEATLAAVSQTIQIGEETPNVWALFKELLPRDPLLVGTLANTDGSTSIITLLDGGVITVRGTGTVGNKYYIRAGRIEGDAPTMTQNEIVV